MRIDVSMVNKGYAKTREKARFLIESGFVKVNGYAVKKCSYNFKDGDLVEITEKMPYVSRAGLKLKAAIDGFKTVVKGSVCLDIGASTGGFTDCLLQEGAEKVYAVDVGTDQLDKKLKNDIRVKSFEGVDIRKFDLSLIEEPLDIIVVDISFISIKLILDVLLKFINRHTKIFVLFKPQFEVGRENLKKGIVVSKEKAEEKLQETKILFAENGLIIEGEMKSPVKGKEGNQEFLLYIKPGKDFEK